MHYCSLRTNERKQVSVSLHNVHIQHSNSTKDDSNDDSNNDSNKNVTSLDKLHTYMESHLDWKSTSTSTSTSTSASDPPVHLRFSEDAGLLKCAKPVKMEEDPKFTIFGVSENQSLFSRKSSRGSGSGSGSGNDSGSDGQHDDNPYVMTKDDDLRVIVEEYKPSAANVIEEEIKGANMVIPKNVYAPHYDWSTRTHTRTSRSHNGNISDREAEATATLDNSPSTNTSTCKSTHSDACDTNAGADARIKFIDLSALQKWRRNHCKPNGEFFAMNSPAAICYFLRSVLKYGNGNGGGDGDGDCIGEDGDGEASEFSQSAFGNHSSSPWRDFCALENNANANANTNTQTNSFDSTHTPESDHTDQVIAILLSNRVTNVESSRPMGDKYFWDELEELEIKEFEKFRTGDACPNFYLYSTSGFKGTFNVSDMLHGNKNEECELERDREREHIRSSLTMLVYRQLPPRPQFQKRLESSEEELMDGCLWEKLKSSVENEGCDGDGDGDDEQRMHGYRMVSPPYQNISDVCGDILQTLTSKENLKILTDEAKRIPQWTAWPEKTHYQSEYDDDESNIDSAYPASWTVFPLCHTFPASDVSKRKFIPLTCSYTPKTTAMLKSLGPKLRTALFSRLEPRTMLGAHTGWADLANHILRVHIPLSVPKGIDNAGLCGCWVDGCVETHEDGRIISFDDSKTHRAFNYTEEERIVLIVDLERPLEKFPLGTATGGHTNELEGFINQFT